MIAITVHYKHGMGLRMVRYEGSGFRIDHSNRLTIWRGLDNFSTLFEEAHYRINLENVTRFTVRDA